MHLNNHRICQATYTINHITNQNHHQTSPTHASTSGSTVVGRASTDLHLPNAVTFTRRGKSFRKCQEAARSGEHCCSHVSIECCKLPPSYNPTSNIHSGVNALAARAGWEQLAMKWFVVRSEHGTLGRAAHSVASCFLYSILGMIVDFLQIIGLFVFLNKMPWGMFSVLIFSFHSRTLYRILVMISRIHIIHGRNEPKDSQTKAQMRRNSTAFWTLWKRILKLQQCTDYGPVWVHLKNQLDLTCVSQRCESVRDCFATNIQKLLSRKTGRSTDNSPGKDREHVPWILEIS